MLAMYWFNRRVARANDIRAADTKGSQVILNATNQSNNNQHPSDCDSADLDLTYTLEHGEMFTMADAKLQSFLNLPVNEGRPAYELCIHPCVANPRHHHHPPPEDKPLRVQVEGPLSAIQKLCPGIQWHTRLVNHPFPQPAGPLLARCAFEKIYGHQPSAEEGSRDLVLRGEYIGWVLEDRHPIE